jgi:hypothetical protein
MEGLVELNPERKQKDRVHFYRYSSLYARYFLYAMNEKSDFEGALTTRGVLMEGAKESVTETSRIEALLASKGVPIKPFDTKPVFDAFKKLLTDDGVNSTPTCVIEQGAKTVKTTGEADIINALKALK